jgi:hypothetical protein
VEVEVEGEKMELEPIEWKTSRLEVGKVRSGLELDGRD